jgi:hypothetical protein
MGSVSKPDPLHVQDVKPFLSPLWSESQGVIDFCYKVLTVFISRVSALYSSLSIEGVWRWKNNAYFNALIEETDLFDPNFKEIKTELYKRGALTPHPFMLQPFKSCKPLLDTIKRCQATRELYEKAQAAFKAHNGRDLKIRKVKEIPFSADCHFQSGIIRIRGDIKTNADALSRIIFELANAIQTERFFEVHQLAVNAVLGRKNYAERQEEIEHRSILIYRETVQRAVEQQGPDWAWENEFYDKNVDKDKYLEMARASGHTRYFEEFWDKHFACQ